jgi:hypothetical protein
MIYFPGHLAVTYRKYQQHNFGKLISIIIYEIWEFSSHRIFRLNNIERTQDGRQTPYTGLPNMAFRATRDTDAKYHSTEVK